MRKLNALWIERNIWKLLLIVSLMIIFLMMTCKGSQTSLAETHKDKAKEHLGTARSETDKSKTVIENYKLKVSELENQVKDYQNKLTNSQKSVNSKLAVLKSYNNSDIANYYLDRFSLNEGVKSIDTTTIAIKDNVSRLVISELIKYDGLKYDTPILKNQLIATNEKYEVANKTIDTLKISINNISSAYENANSEKDLAIKDIERQVRSERRKKNFWKYSTMVVGAVSGYLLITK